MGQTNDVWSMGSSHIGQNIQPTQLYSHSIIFSQQALQVYTSGSTAGSTSRWTPGDGGEKQIYVLHRRHSRTVPDSQHISIVRLIPMPTRAHLKLVGAKRSGARALDLFPRVRNRGVTTSIAAKRFVIEGKKQVSPWDMRTHSSEHTTHICHEMNTVV